MAIIIYVNKANIITSVYACGFWKSSAWGQWSMICPHWVANINHQILITIRIEVRYCTSSKIRMRCQTIRLWREICRIWTSTSTFCTIVHQYLICQTTNIILQSIIIVHAVMNRAGNTQVVLYETFAKIWTVLSVGSSIPHHRNASVRQQLVIVCLEMWYVSLGTITAQNITKWW